MTSWRPRLVALDVDGTIVDETNAVSAKVRSAIHALRERGIEIVISTGRGIPGVLDTVEKLALPGQTAVASNGAVVFDYYPVDVVHQETFDAGKAVRRILEQVPDAIVAVEDIGRGFRANRSFPDGEISGETKLEDVDSLIADPVTRVVIRSTDHTAEEFSAIVGDLGLTGTNYFVGYSAWLDLAPEGVSKASGLQVLCDRRGIDPGEVLAVGDGNNDLEMLAWAGRGVAMGHAPAALKNVADDVTGSIHDDGLHAELLRYL
jgi:Cof subfamily protein (haloacid dehalogenase superfamily)